MGDMTFRLLEAVRAAVPAVAEITVGTPGNSATVTVKPPEQQAAAQAAIDGFDWSQAAHNLWLAARTGNAVVRHAMVRLPSGAVNSTTALADVAGLGFQLKPNTHYAFRFDGGYTAAANTTGLSLALSGPASPAALGVIGKIWMTATAAPTVGIGVAYNTPLTAASSSGATRMPFEVTGNITTGAAGGALALRFASEVGGSAVTILAGSQGELKEVSAG